MIQIKKISPEEAQKLNDHFHLSYWVIPISLTMVLLPVTLILNWLFDAPWSVFWWISGGLFTLFALVRLLVKKPPQLNEGMVKIIRRGKVIDVSKKGNRPLSKLNLDQHINITLAPEPTPSDYPEYDTFRVYQTVGMPYYPQDGSLQYRMANLINKEVEIEYLAESGKVLAFRELNPASTPRQLYLRWGNIQLSSEKTIVSQERVDFIAMSSDLYGNTGLFLRSDSEPNELFIPLYTKNINQLEDWLFTLDGFNKDQYIQLKENPPTEEKNIWERRIKLGVSYRSVYAGERVSILMGTIYVYRNNGHNESIRPKEVDYISINSFCKEQPNTEFYINLRSFRRSGVSFQSRAEGFSKLENWMKQLPNFDAAQYLSLKANVGEQAKAIWIRKPVANAKLLQADEKPQAITGLERGMYLENLDRWLDWGTFGDLSRLEPKKWLSMKKTSYPNPNARGYTYIIKNPVILGGLEVNCLQSQTPYWLTGASFNRDWPVTSYWADVSFGNGGIGDFELLKLHFTQIIGLPNSYADPTVDGDNSMWASWLIDRVAIKISTWKPDQLDIFQHSCRLDISYDARVDHLYTDEYTLGLKLHDQLRYQVLEGELSVAFDYAHHPHSRYTPRCIAELIQTEQQCIIWHDEKHAKLGIGNKRAAQVLDLAEVTGLTLTGSYWRDSPGKLQFHFVDEHKNNRYVGTSNYLGELDTEQGDSRWPLICEQMELFLGMPCNYLEDRQYY
ncbi:MAG: hypothetical protein M3421_12565 [Bacteroidota bacterium]|nr:hypothetical protein [Bacteroidota bacterium]